MSTTEKQTLSAGITPAIQLRGAAQHLCYATARLFLNSPLRSLGFRCDKIKCCDSMNSFKAERAADVSRYRQLFAPFVRFEGKIVMELGCNRGYLLEAFLREEKFKAIGVDMVSSFLDEARADAGDCIEFVQSTPTSIPLPDESVDVIYTIDTVEHLSHAREMFLECARILRPGGMFLVDFYPWLGPYGSHMGDIIPFPWPQVIFSMDTLLDTAAYLYESPNYEAWHCYIDEKTGAKVPNPFVDRAKWEEYLNHLTIKQFKQLLKELPLELLHYEHVGFSGRTFKLARLITGLSQVPGLDEYFTTYAFCVLQKPSAMKGAR